MNIRDEAIIRMYIANIAPKWLVKVLLWMARRHVVQEKSFIYIPRTNELREL